MEGRGTTNVWIHVGCVWRCGRSGLRDSLQSVHWGRAELLSVARRQVCATLRWHLRLLPVCAPRSVYTFTGTIRCLIENEENHERVDPCRGCVEVWKVGAEGLPPGRSGLRDSLQSVHWGRAELLSEVCFGGQP